MSAEGDRLISALNCRKKKHTSSRYLDLLAKSTSHRWSCDIFYSHLLRTHHVVCFENTKGS